MNRNNIQRFQTVTHTVNIDANDIMASIELPEVNMELEIDPKEVLDNLSFGDIFFYLTDRDRVLLWKLVDLEFHNEMLEKGLK